MRKISKYILWIVAACFLTGCNQSVDSREAFVRYFFEQYPKATLQDLYKGSFQDQFGPAHLLTDREAVKKYIKQEMDNAKTYPGEDFVACGWQERFYQVNLKVIADGRVSLDAFTDAFMASANGIDTSLTPAFLKEWSQLLQAVKQVQPQLSGFTQDSTMLANLLAEGKYVVHHSKTFDETYQPHYRIIRRDLFEKHILPHLK